MKIGDKTTIGNLVCGNVFQDLRDDIFIVVEQYVVVKCGKESRKLQQVVSISGWPYWCHLDEQVVYLGYLDTRKIRGIITAEINPHIGSEEE